MMRVVGETIQQTGGGGSPVLVDIEMSQHYRHSLGRSSPFFSGLADQVLRATSCDSCQATFFPPRPYCDQDLSRTSWYDLPGSGAVVAATVVHSPPPFGGIEAPYVLASIRLDGVDGGITHRVLGDVAPAAGTVVSVRFLDGAPAHPLLRIAFAPDPHGRKS
jgi:uncharacterized OB-fold protein